MERQASDRHSWIEQEVNHFRRLLNEAVSRQGHYTVHANVSVADGKPNICRSYCEQLRKYATT